MFKTIKKINIFPTKIPQAVDFPVGKMPIPMQEMRPLKNLAHLWLFWSDTHNVGPPNIM